MQIQILIGALPPLLRPIVEDAVGSQPDMCLLHDASATTDLDSALFAFQPDVVVLGECEAGGATACQELVMKIPGLKLVAIGDDGRRADIYEFRRLPLVDLSPQALVDAIRDAVGAPFQTISARGESHEPRSER